LRRAKIMAEEPDTVASVGLDMDTAKRAARVFADGDKRRGS
jgi:hypothetical protein